MMWMLHFFGKTTDTSLFNRSYVSFNNNTFRFLHSPMGRSKYWKTVHWGRRENALAFSVCQYLWWKSPPLGGGSLLTNATSLHSAGRGADHQLSRPVARNISCSPKCQASLLPRDSLFLCRDCLDWHQQQKPVQDCGNRVGRWVGSNFTVSVPQTYSSRFIHRLSPGTNMGHPSVGSQGSAGPGNATAVSCTAGSPRPATGALFHLG